VFQNVLLLIQTTESGSSLLAFTEEFTSQCTQDTAIPEVAEVQSVCTRYAADLMVEQVKLTLTIEYIIKTLSDSKDVVISYKDRSHCFTRNWNMFMHLPANSFDAMQAHF